MADSKATKSYFSRSVNLTIGAVKGKQVLQEGQLTRIGEKIIQFYQQGPEDKWGVFRTDDPELIEILERRCDEVGDTFRAEEYNRLATPPEVRVVQLERQLEEANRLLQQYSGVGAARVSPEKKEHRIAQ